ncbi:MULTISPECIES: 5-formyltetrahydrofolate cyclo-ligase [unclassified Moraxella]|uniref:5-formyltetrahydrofolate cyclo-ligase n=1 Tax=unclassified Moraxella TaxID=2685852 RepID=UPI00359D44FC
MDNATLRKNIKKQRKALTQKQRQRFAFLAGLHLPKLLPHLPKHANIGLYLDDFGELPTAPIMKFCQKYGFTPYLPITKQGKPLTFAPCFYQPTKTPLKRHTLGMKEPMTKPSLTAKQMDCIICPLVAVDQLGHRLGMGGGFYDRTFANFHGLKVGWCYHFQMVDRLAVNDWDQRVDLVITDSNILRFF